MSADVAGLRMLAELIAAMPDPSAEAEFWRQLAREAYALGRADGWREGYERGARLRESEWPAVVAAVVSDRPDQVALERSRWGPGGRERFGDPRPGDRFPRLEAAS